jgi:hypothetical protein
MKHRIAVVVLCLIGIGMLIGTWFESSDWSDNGHINWVGELKLQHYENNSLMFSQNITFYLLPYSVQTTSHGVFNFSIDVHPNFNDNYIPLNGTIVGVTHDRDGMTFPVFKQ